MNRPHRSSFFKPSPTEGIIRRNLELEVRACRCCLTTDTPLSIMSIDICLFYSQLMGNLNSPESPKLVCAYCQHLLRKFQKFRTRCNSAELILKRTLLWNKDIQNLSSHEKSELSLGLSITLPEIISYQSLAYTASPGRPVSLTVTKTLNCDLSINATSPFHQRNEQRPVQEDTQNNMDIETEKWTTINVNHVGNDEASKDKNKNNHHERFLTYNDLIHDEQLNLREEIPPYYENRLIDVQIHTEDQTLPENENQIEPPDEDMELDTKENLVIKEENLIHPVDDDDAEKESQTQINNTKEIENEQTILSVNKILPNDENHLVDDLQKHAENDQTTPDDVNNTEPPNEDMEVDTKDDLIIKEENLIHPVDDDDNENEPQNQERNTKELQNTEKRDKRKTPEVILTYDIDSSSSCSSSSTSSSSSSSSSSSDSDDEVEFQELPATEIDLTIDDDDNIKLKNVTENNITNKNDSACNNKQNNVEIIVSEKSANLTDTTTNTAQDTSNIKQNVAITVENKNSAEQLTDIVQDKSLHKKTVIDETELNFEEFNRPNTVEVVSESNDNVPNDEVNLETLTNVEIPTNSLKTNHSGIEIPHRNTGAKRTTHIEESSSDSENDLPDCLFGLNSDIYKKDIKRPFSKGDSGIPPPTKKVHYVEEIYVNNKPYKLGDKVYVDDICDSENMNKKKAKIGDFNKVRQKFEETRKKSFSFKQKYVINKEFTVPRSETVNGTPKLVRPRGRVVVPCAGRCPCDVLCIRTRPRRGTRDGDGTT